MQVESRVEAYWYLGGLAIFLLIPFDMMTTAGAAYTHGISAEVNPLIRWSLKEGLLTFTAVNLLAGALALIGLYLLIETIKRAEDGWQRWLTERTYEIWVTTMILAGILVGVNNLMAIFVNVSLFSFI